MENDLEIKFNKKKIFKSFIIVFVIFVGSVCVLLFPESFVSVLFRNKYIIFILGIFSTIFIGLFLILLVSKLLNNKVGLTINNNGLINNTDYKSVGLINWEDILEVKIKQFSNGKYLVLILKDDKKYLDKIKNSLLKLLLYFNKHQYGSIIHINYKFLDCNLEELKKNIVDNLNKK